jgi:transcriptional regulator with XRE-family HTH domain
MERVGADQHQNAYMVRSVFSNDYKRFLALLIAERKSAGLTQQDLADRLGKPQSFVSKYERGERRLDVVEFIDVARIMGADPGKIIAKLAARTAGLRR